MACLLVLQQVKNPLVVDLEVGAVDVELFVLGAADVIKHLLHRARDDAAKLGVQQRCLHNRVSEEKDRAWHAEKDN